MEKTSQLIAQNLGTFQPPTTAYSQGSATSEQAAFRNFESLFSNIIGFLTALGAIAFVLFFVVGAFEWITSGGEKGKLEHARNRMMYGAIGMIIIVAAYGILGLMSSVVGIDFLNPAQQLQRLIPGR